MALPIACRLTFAIAAALPLLSQVESAAGFRWLSITVFHFRETTPAQGGGMKVLENGRGFGVDAAHLHAQRLDRGSSFDQVGDPRRNDHPRLAFPQQVNRSARFHAISHALVRRLPSTCLLRAAQSITTPGWQRLNDPAIIGCQPWTSSTAVTFGSG